MSLLSGPTLSVKLAEPFVFVTTPNRGQAGRQPAGPALVRGLLVLKLPKATKITSIDVIFDGKATTDWPEGIGPRRLEVSENIPLISLKTSFLDSASTDRRALSLGPGIRFDDYEPVQNDEFLQRYPRSSAPRENPPAFEAEASVPSVDTRSGSVPPQRAASALPAYDRLLNRGAGATEVHDLGTSSHESPPYTPRHAAASLPQSPLPQSPSHNDQVSVFTSTSGLTRAVQNETNPAALERGRSFMRGSEESPVLATRHSYHEELEHPPDRYPDADSQALDPDAPGVDPEDHPMSVIPEDPDPSEQDVRAPVGSTVNVTSTPTTGPPSAASSVYHLGLQRWQSSTSATDHSSGEAGSPTLEVTTSSLQTASPIPLSPVPTRTSRPSIAETAGRQNSDASSASQPHTPTEALLATRRDSQRSLSPSISSLTNGHPPRTTTTTRATRGVSPISSPPVGRVSAGADRSPSRGRPGHTSRFSLSTVTHILREVSQDVRDAVGGSGRERRSRSRVTAAAERPGTLSLSRAPSSTDDRPPSSHPLNPPRPPHPDRSAGEFVRGYGRGGAGSLDRDRDSGSRRSRTRDRDREDGRPAHRHDTDDDDELVGHRGRDVTVNPIGESYQQRASSPVRAEGWKEMRKGTYTYPISFVIPPELPPSLRCDFGSVSYRLKATVHRAGTFAPKITSALDVNLVSCLSPDSTDDLDNIIVQRSWEDKLSYVVHIEGTAFPIGGIIPVNITIMPLDKISVYRVNVGIDEKIDYYAHGRKVARHEPVQFYDIVSIRNEDKHQRLLPIISDSATAALTSPLAPYARPGADEEPALAIPPSASTETLEHTSDVTSHLLNPSGPWHFHFDVQIPDCNTDIHFTNKGPGARIVVLHRLKTVLRVAAGVHDHGDVKEKPKLFDIIIETPIHLLSCQCQSSYTHLPTYTQLPTPLSPPPNKRSSSGTNPDEHHHHHVRASSTYTRRNNPILVPALGPSRGGAAPSYARAQSQSGAHPHLGTLSFVPTHMGAVNMRTPSADDRSRAESSASAARHAADAIQRSEQFARLVAGQESEAGEQPPAYSS